MKTIKNVATKRYNLSLVEGSGGLYYIKLDLKANQEDEKKSDISDGIEDLRVAFFAYDAKLTELEGN